VTLVNAAAANHADGLVVDEASKAPATAGTRMTTATALSIRRSLRSNPAETVSESPAPISATFLVTEPPPNALYVAVFVSCDDADESRTEPLDGSMPLVRIEIAEGRPARIREGLLDAVHGALVEALAIPDGDRTQRLIEHDRMNFEMDVGRSEDYVLVEITMFPGRSRDAKKALYASIVRNLGRLGISADDITIVLHEPPLVNWGIRGGMPADEVDIGYDLGV
jgi:phenylpyruvate tautomerase PptA (4-oxalocrotonate tautomerase family)